MTKLLACRKCRDVVMLHTDTLRLCRCGKSTGIFLSDKHHALIIGPAIALGLFNEDLTAAFQPNIESGYYPVRAWRIPDGDRIITMSVTTSGAAVTARCSRCKPCEYSISVAATPAQAGTMAITVEVKKGEVVMQTLPSVELMPDDPAMKIVVNDQVHLSEFRSSDKDALIQHLNDREIYERTLRIPFPYTDASADEWLALVANMTEQQGQPVHWAIRSADDTLIGGCGFDGFQVGKSEVGYWLAKPLWGRGMMTAVVQRVCQHAFEAFGLMKITAHVFTYNPASARVLEKCGFQEEGLLRKHFVKDGQFIDARLFALLR